MTEEKKMSSFGGVLLWFGAAVSIAEILTGALLAPLGLTRGLWAILLGHLIGAAILLPAGLIGAKTGLSSAQSVGLSFGRYGSFGFSVLNILQLLGWTAIMIVNGAKAFNGITGQLWNFENETLWSIVIGLLICLWVLLGMKNLTKVNWVVISALFVFSLVLGVTVFSKTGVPQGDLGTMSFGGAVELNVAMSLSWLPLIGDYTRKLQKKTGGTLWSVFGYAAGSALMFVIGLGAALFAGTSDIAQILLSAGLGLIALVIVLFSTVTTTFLDVYSAGVCCTALHGKTPEKAAAVGVCLLGTVLAILVPMSQYENFLYLIGSVFAPLFAIVFVDFFVRGKTKAEEGCKLDIKNVVLWALGVLLYRLLMPLQTPLGITLPVMLLVGAAAYLLSRFTFLGKKRERHV